MKRWSVVVLLSALPVGVVLANQHPVEATRSAGDTRTLNSLAEIMQADTEAPALLGVVQVQKTPTKDIRQEQPGTRSKATTESSATLVQQNQVQQKRIIQLTRTIATLNAALVEARANKGKSLELSQQLKVLQAREGEQGQEVARLMAELQQARTAMISLQKVVDEQGGMTPALKDSQSKVAQLQMKVEALQKSAEGQRTLASTLTQAQTALKDSQSKVAQLQTKVDALQKSAEGQRTLASTLTQAKTALKDSQGMVAQLQMKVEALQKSAEGQRTLASTLTQAQTALKDSQSKVAQLQTKVEALQKSAEGQRTLASTLTQAQTALKDSQGMVAQLQAKVDALQKSAEGQRTLASSLTQAQTALKDSQGMVAQLQMKVDALQKSAEGQRTLASTLTQAQTALKDNQSKMVQLQAKVADLQKQVLDESEAVKAKETTLIALQKKLETSEKALVVATTPRKPSPDKPKEVRDYAVGTSLANDMLSLLKTRAASGVVVDKDMVLAGVKDTFSGTVQVPEAALKLALADSAKDVDKKLREQKEKAERDGKAFMAAFSAKSGVKKDTDGFLYRVDYLGQGTISDTDTVSIVMTESLSNGTVVKDMEALGTFVSQPLNAYPPLFQKVIKLLNNHGSLTLVVPPELAYGNAGYPPLVPPGATMVYKLRVRDVIPGTEAAGK
ncbi:FKBP-type peptidyl-prolyl cis-trans isomerase N-terminal domain-containing protein (plasmid) [Serratia nevei]|uniref:FKBP-type peptidyl-prolyl cis-trans isomerase N-terminal domain-containing protein n=1 Tax=Serratia nevei TaxID=2703794 RepID=UPI003F6D12AE